MRIVSPKACGYEKVMGDICARIVGGQLASSQRVGSIRSLSERHGVSINPVQRALKELEQHDILRKVGNGKSGGYIVTEEAPALANEFRRAKTDLAAGSQIRADIGILFCGAPDLGSQNYSLFFMPILRALQETLAAQRYRAAMSLISEQNVNEQFDYFRLMESALDGLVLTPGSWPEAVVKVMSRLRVPLVWLNQRASSWAKQLPVAQTEVYSDDETGVADAVRHLSERGHRRIGLIVAESVNVFDRILGYRRALQEAGLARQPDSLERMIADATQVSFADGRAAAARAAADLLDRPDAPTAVFCTNDITAFGVIDYLRERSLTPGLDVSVVGYDDIESAGFTPFGRPVLTTLRKPRQEIGAEAARVLIERWANPQRSGLQSITLVPRLVERQSCGPVSDRGAS